MFRAKQLSSLLTNFPAKSYAARYLVDNKNVLLSKSLVSSRFYCSKDDGGKKKIPSIHECPDTSNMMSELPCPKPTFDEHNRNARNKYKKTLLISLLFTAVTFAVAYKVIWTSNVPKKPLVQPVSNKEKKKKAVKIPSTSADIPKEVPYLLIGGGTASFSAFRAIKSADPTARVLVVSKEEYYPYMRPPLSKEIWFNEDKDAVKKLIFKQWNGSERSLFYEPDDFYIPCKELMTAPNGGVAVARGWNITRLDVTEKKAYLDDGTAIQYKKALVATGAKTKKMPILEAASVQDPVIAERVKYYREIKDFEEVDKIFAKSKSIAIIGGGFLGSELACALARREKKKGSKEIVQIFKESGNMGKVLPEYLSFWTTDKVSGEGVTVKTNSEIISVKSEGNKVVLNLNNGQSFTVDNIIVAIGVEPNTEFAKESDLETDPDFGGYLVNTELQARSDLYIAGDCSCFYDPLLGRRRIEHHDHAVVSGRLAGENMTGAAKPYSHQSMFWSDLGPDVGYEAVGIVDSSLPTVGVFAKATYKDNPQAAVTQSGEGDRSKSEEIPKECMKRLTEKEAAELREIRRNDSKPNLKDGEDFGKGVIFYLKDDIVVGIVLWNIFNRMSIARQVLKAQNKYDDLNEVAKLFNIHEE